MSVYKDAKSGKWFSQLRYKSWDGKPQRTTKRGFETKREALQWEREFILQKAGSNNMTFEDFVSVYKADLKPRIKESTFDTKETIIDKKILPYFANMPLNQISTTDVMYWQNEMMNAVDPKTGKKYSKSYLKTLHNQLSAILNHAVKYYKLEMNPAEVVGNMGSEKDIKMKCWTSEQYHLFSESMMEKTVSFYCFEVLYWGGLRLGEMLALTPADIDFEKNTISINKTYHRAKGRDIVTSPKTSKSDRVVTVPKFLCDELKDYLDMSYDIGPEDRMFNVSKDYIEHEMKRGIKEQGLPRIRVHDLRHSHVSLLINMGYSAVAIADRMGHESINITYRYAHLFPNVNTEIADKLNEMKKGI